MRRLLLLVCLPALLVAACGSAQDRPEIVATFPGTNQVIPGTISSIRVTYDDAVTILNPAQVSVTTGGVYIPVWTQVDPDDPRTIVVRPLNGQYFRAGQGSLTLGAGFVTNTEDHYALDTYYLYFRLGASQPVYFGVPAPAAVIEAEAETFTHVHTTPTPGGRAPTGLVVSTVQSLQRVWVQLEHGAGVAEALAYFEPGAAAMSTVALTVEPGGDLVAPHAALALTPDGTTLYAAWRDTALGRVRLSRVDVLTAAETGSLVLSPPASLDTQPEGASLTRSGDALFVACASTAGARLVVVDPVAFLETDVGPDAGVDGLPLPDGAGPVAGGNDVAYLAPRASLTADLTWVLPSDGTVTPYPSLVDGSPSCILLTPDRVWEIEGAAGFSAGQAFSYRLRSNPPGEHVVTIDDDTGLGNPPATSVLSIDWFPGTSRLLALLDNDAAVLLGFASSGIEQVDPYPLTEPVEAIDLSLVAPGATLVAFPAPSVEIQPPD